MKYLRTLRSYEAFTTTVGDKEHTVSAQAVGVSAGDAEQIVEDAARYGVEVEVFDEKPDPADVPQAAGVSAPDLSRGIGAISGNGAPVQTFAPADGTSQVEADPYDGMLKADLAALVDERNADRDEADQIQVGGNGTVADLKTALAADDNKEL